MATNSTQHKPPLIRPSDEVDNIIRWFDSFDDLKFNFIDEFDDISILEGKEWINKNGWEKIAEQFNMTIEVSVEEVSLEDKQWKALARAEMDDGRYMTGVALSTNEGLAKTRAMNRAISDMIAAGRVSAEEIANE